MGRLGIGDAFLYLFNIGLDVSVCDKYVFPSIVVIVELGHNPCESGSNWTLIL